MESISAIQFVIYSFLFSLAIAGVIWTFKKQPFIGLALGGAMIYFLLRNEYVQIFLTNLNVI